MIKSSKKSPLKPKLILLNGNQIFLNQLYTSRINFSTPKVKPTYTQSYILACNCYCKLV